MKLKQIKTEVGGVVVFTREKDELTFLVERHALIPASPGWEATYYGPNDVRALEIRLDLARGVRAK